MIDWTEVVLTLADAAAGVAIYALIVHVSCRRFWKEHVMNNTITALIVLTLAACQPRVQPRAPEPEPAQQTEKGLQLSTQQLAEVMQGALSELEFNVDEAAKKGNLTERARREAVRQMAETKTAIEIGVETSKPLCDDLPALIRLSEQARCPNCKLLFQEAKKGGCGP